MLDQNSGLLSIIVPVYNVESYLEACLNSLLGQEYSNLEIILINDGSIDGSLEICQLYQKRDKRIKLYSQNNVGLAITRSRGLDYANGEFITFVDSDDEVLPKTYVEALRVLSENPRCDQVQFPLHKRVGTPSQEIISNRGEAIYGSEQMLHAWVVDREISWIVCNKIFRREVIDDLRFKPGVVYEDNLFVAQQLQRSKGICFSHKGGYLYYYRGESITNTFTDKNMYDMITIHIDIYNELRKYPKLYMSRTHMAYMIACDVYACKNWFRGQSVVADAGMRFLRTLPIVEIVKTRGLALKRKLKTLAIVAYSYIWMQE